MTANDITGEEADRYWEQIKAFADFGFPESHSASFAHIVYASAWMKVHYPAAFYLGLLNSQPMGFYSPASLIADAQRHGITVHAPDVNASAADTTVTETERAAAGPVRGAADLRLGLGMVHGLAAKTAARIAKVPAPSADRSPTCPTSPAEPTCTEATSNVSQPLVPSPPSPPTGEPPSGPQASRSNASA
jgi:DNA polymerase III alpha subunit